MSQTVTTTQLEALTRFGNAVSDSVRARILLRLRFGAAYPAELADDFGVSRQLMSNHLACLRGCGLIVREQEGRRFKYTLSDAHIAPALDNLLEMVLSTDPECCCRHGKNKCQTG